MKSAEVIADSIWKRVVVWDEFAKDVLGKQIARAAYSMGANIAESFGRYNFGEKLQFLYYSRGSLFETKYWLNRAQARGLMNPNEIREYVGDLTSLARQLNAFAAGLKTVRAGQLEKKSAVRESLAEYFTGASEEFSAPLFSEDGFNWLNS